MRKIFILVLLATSSLFSQSLQTIYNSLDPLSVTQNLAYYNLYKDTDLGKQALLRAIYLLSKNSENSNPLSLSFPNIRLDSIIALVTKEPSSPPILLEEEELAWIEKVSSHLANRKKKGAYVWSRKEVKELPPEEIDLARGLLLNQYDDVEKDRNAIRQYEASMDLMALQIMARLPANATNEDTLHEISKLIFHEMRFRFPPHSLMAKDVDVYTFLPSVLDNRQGVCLGVSILYLCLAQRLDLQLEIITPPGHIYVRYNNGQQILNIETTARGIDLPSENYLGVNTRKLQLRNIKEVIGMAFMNQAATVWQRKDYPFAIQLYEKASDYMPNDQLLNTFLGYNYLFVGKKTQGEKLLKPLQNYTFDYAVSKDTIIDDYFNGRCDALGIQAIFLPVDENRNSIIKKQQELQKILEKYPKFRAGILQLAVSYLQLGRTQEALEVLERYHHIDPTDATVEYYLSALAIERMDYQKGWKHLILAEKLSDSRKHYPKALQVIRSRLKTVYPEPV